MFQVAIIGAGQLGSRHLQGLKSASSPLSITVMDSSEDSLRVAEERYLLTPQIGDKSIQYVKSLNDLPEQLDLVIIATGAKPRATIVKDLLSISSVRYMILEKVLFTQLSDYDEIEALLENRNVVCWVNCPRRMFGSYSLIKDKIDYSEPIKMEFVGRDWGLCCNSMHFIDAFMFLTQEEDFTVDTSKVENKVFDSKRPGYIEMKGTLHARTVKGNELYLSSIDSINQQSRVEIKNGLNYYSLDEMKGILLIDGKEIKVDVPYQSQTTGILADSILRTGFCPLSMFDKSVKYHKVFINKMLEKYNEITKEDHIVLPIT